MSNLGSLIFRLLTSLLLPFVPTIRVVPLLIITGSIGAPLRPPGTVPTPPTLPPALPEVEPQFHLALLRGLQPFSALRLSMLVAVSIPLFLPSIMPRNNFLTSRSATKEKAALLFWFSLLTSE